MQKSAQKKMGRGEKFIQQVLVHWPLYVMVIPALLYIILFAYKPMYGVTVAFKDFSLRKGIMKSPWVGLANFERMFSSYWFPIILKNTLTLSSLSLFLSFPAPILLALMVNEIGNERVKRTFQTVSYAPHFISTVVICGMIILFLSPSSGIINKVITLFGGEKVYFMQKPQYFKWIYVISGIWQETGWSAIIYFAALSGVDRSLLEAAEIDGANRIQRIIHINLPVLIPTIAVLLILRCGSILSIGYEKVYLLQNSTNLTGSEIISTYVYKVGLQQNDFAFSTATGLFNSVVNTIILVSANIFSNKVVKVGLW
ncbi:MAG: sugar ABC transporter permease [Clostridia bacterium]|nr:sugar ABC transporter permease [Clostridia bacterium]